MGAISNWLTHDDQSDLFEVVVAVALNLLFLVLVTLLLWPLNRLGLAFSLAKGYGLLWFTTWVSAALVNFAQRLFRVNIYDHGNAYVVSNLVVSCVLQAAWSVFAAIMVQRFIADVSIWVMVILYGVGIVSCLTAYFAVSAFFQGQIYRLVSLPLALVIFIIVSVIL